jgi:hypothetical protein
MTIHRAADVQNSTTVLRRSHLDASESARHRWFRRSSFVRRALAREVMQTAQGDLDRVPSSTLSSRLRYSAFLHL